MINKFENAVADTISRHSLLVNGDKVVVALSGGADSVALLSSLCHLGYDCIAAHCNFHLRGEESQRDMLHAEAVCSKLGVELSVKDFDVAKRTAKYKESVEMACRALRYEWFGELLISENANVVAVGHHIEDNIETFLLNLMRGTGLEGLCGMKYRRDHIIRPLLDVKRAEIEEYLNEVGLTYIVDSSNSSDLYQRNRLRNWVMPELERNFPNAGKAILSAMSNLASSFSIYKNAISRYRDACELAPWKFDLNKLDASAGHSSATVLYEMLKADGITASQCQDIVSSVSKSGLKFKGKKGGVFELDRGVLSRIEHAGFQWRTEEYDIDLHYDVSMPVNIRVSWHDISEFSPVYDRNVIYIDQSAVKDGHHWRLRHWRKGDRIMPFGMHGSKLLSDLFSDAKYTSEDKRNAWVLTCNEEIIWAVGLRVSRKYTITQRTSRFIRLEYFQ